MLVMLNICFSPYYHTYSPPQAFFTLVQVVLGGRVTVCVAENAEDFVLSRQAKLRCLSWVTQSSFFCFQVYGEVQVRGVFPVIPRQDSGEVAVCIRHQLQACILIFKGVRCGFVRVKAAV